MIRFLLALSITLFACTVSQVGFGTQGANLSVNFGNQGISSPTAISHVITVSVSHVNLRSVPGTYGTPDSSVIAVLSEGQSLTTTGECQDGWLRVMDGNLTGWVNAAYVNPNKCGH